MNRTIYLLSIILFGLTLHAGARDAMHLARKMYSTQRAMQVGDLLTVIVNEQSSSSKNESLSTAKTSVADADPAALGSVTGRSLSQKLSDLDIPGYNVRGTSEFTGSGATSSSEAFTANFNARVIDVHDNDVLLIRGTRQIKLRHENIEMIITGFVRRRDISADNSIQSSQIADAYISYATSGKVSRGSRPGWFWNIFQILNPF